MVHGFRTIAEAAAVIGVRPGTLYAWLRLGKIPHITQKDLVLIRGERISMNGSIQRAGRRLNARPIDFDSATGVADPQGFQW